MAGNRTLSLTIVATSESAQKNMAGLADQADKLGLHVQQAGQKISTSAEHTEAYGEKSRAAFDAVQAGASAIGANLGPAGEALERFSSGLAGIDGHASKTERSMRAMSAAATALGGIITIEAAQDEAAMAQLKNAVENTGKSWEDYAPKLEAAAKAQAAYGHSAKDATDALTVLTAAFNDPTRAMQEMTLTENLSAREHISLADAAGEVARVHAGAFKELTKYGIAVKDLVDPSKELAQAQKDQASAAAALSGAQERLSNFEATLQAQEQAGQEKHAAAVQAAQEALATAEQRLGDVTVEQAQRRKDAQDSADAALAASTETLTTARQHLADVEQAVHDRTQLTLADQRSLRDAGQSLADVQQHIADGDLKGAAAQEALRDAQQHVADVTADQADKVKVTTADQVAHRQAVDAVAKASEAHALAATKATGAGRETTAEQIAQRNAVEAVAKAHEGVAKAQGSYDGSPRLGQLQEEKKLRDEVTKATERQAKANAEKAKAEQDQADFGAKTDEALALLGGKVKGSADAASRTVQGMFKRYLADAQNFFAGLGTNFGMALFGIGAGLDLFLTLSKTKLATSFAEMAADAAVWAGEMLIDGAMAVASVLPFIVVIAAVAFAAYELYKHWDTVWAFIKTAAEDGWHFLDRVFHLLINTVFLPWKLEVEALEWVFSEVWDGIKSVAGGLGGFFSGAFDAVSTEIHGMINGIIDALNYVIRFIDSIRFSIHLPSWLGGAGVDFNGFGFPQIPHLATGGIVPGSGTADDTLVYTTPGEVVLNAAQQGNLAALLGARQRQPAPAPVEVHVHLHEGVLVSDRASAHRVGMQLADGVHAGLLRKQSSGHDLQLAGRRG